MYVLGYREPVMLNDRKTEILHFHSQHHIALPGLCIGMISDAKIKASNSAMVFYYMCKATVLRNKSVTSGSNMKKKWLLVICYVIFGCIYKDTLILTCL